MASDGTSSVTTLPISEVTSCMAYDTQSLTKTVPVSSQPCTGRTNDEQDLCVSNPVIKQNIQTSVPVKSNFGKILMEKETDTFYPGDTMIISENGCSESAENNVFSTGNDDVKLFEVSPVANSVLASEAGRKGSFMITRVVAKDVLEDLDDTTNTEDVNSVAMDVSRLTDLMMTEVPSSTDTLHTPDEEIPWPTSPRVGIVKNPMLSPADIHEDAHSRFRIVKIESRDRWHRGRWTCHDFADPIERDVNQLSGTGADGASCTTASIGPSIYYIPGIHDNCKSPFGIVYCDTGVPVLEPSLLTSPLYTRGLQFFAESTDAGVTVQTTSAVVNNSSSVDFDAQNMSITSGSISNNNESSVSDTGLPASKLFSDNAKESLCSLLSASSETVMNKIPLQLQTSDDVSACQLTGNLPSVGSATNLASVGNVLSRTNSQILPLDAMMSATLNLAASNESK
jgi:hypothetical protein